MPEIVPGAALPQYNAGTDGRMSLGAAAADGTLSGVRTIVAEIRKWSKSSSLEGRPSTVTAESFSEAVTGVVPKTHVRHGGVSTTKISGECLLMLNTGKFTPNTFRAGNEYNAALIVDKSSTLGFYGVLLTIMSEQTVGLDVDGRTIVSFEAEVNGLFPLLTAGP